MLEFETVWLKRHPLCCESSIQLWNAPSGKNLNWIEDGTPDWVDTVRLTSSSFSLPGKTVTVTLVSDRESELTGIGLELTTIWAD